MKDKDSDCLHYGRVAWRHGGSRVAMFADVIRSMLTRLPA
jgi:hypothetical protein